MLGAEWRSVRPNMPPVGQQYGDAFQAVAHGYRIGDPHVPLRQGVLTADNTA